MYVFCSEFHARFNGEIRFFITLFARRTHVNPRTTVLLTKNDPFQQKNSVPRDFLNQKNSDIDNFISKVDNFILRRILR